jgi:hypothetical protein
MLAPQQLRLLDILLPKPCPAPLIRVGGDSDGAYLLPDDLQGVVACFSPGVSNRKDFEDELLDSFGIASHMCDFSSDIKQFKTPLRRNQTFEKKWLEPDGGEDSISLQEWVRRVRPAHTDDLLLQMDIEGAEYRNLLKTPPDIMRRFRIVILELHNLACCKDRETFDGLLGPLLKYLDTMFICIHAHPNNCCGDFTISGTPMNLPHVLELTFLRRDRFENRTATAFLPPALPHPLDIAANVPSKPPLFLNEHWLPQAARTQSSSLIMLQHEVHFYKRQYEALRANHAQHVIERLHLLAQHAANLNYTPHPRHSEPAPEEIAKGKPFAQSSVHTAQPPYTAIAAHSPFFVHTEYEERPSITIDFLAPHMFYKLDIVNRSDGFQERARCLFYIIHMGPECDFSCGLPVQTTKTFLTTLNEPSETNLRNGQGRYLTIFSAEPTYLHFANIRVWGTRY